MRLKNKFPLLYGVYESAKTYFSPSTITYLWNFGFYSGICLVLQILTGIFLAMHYVPDQSMAFASVEHIMRDVNFGWLIRYLHANGASMFFIVVYIHTFRGLYYTSYAKPREMLWCVGVAIMLLMIITAFLGYVLPWGQMSFWAATVITNFVSAVPKLGTDIVIWIWGGFAVDNPTLNRFFSLHYLLPFVILGLVMVHLILLHETGSNNPYGVRIKYDGNPLYPYFFVKDLLGLLHFFLFFAFFVFFYPNVLGHPDNYIMANPLVTPTHIVPEWYFLPYYGILRSIPDKLLGVLALVFSILVLMVIPFLAKVEVRSFTFRPLSQIFFWFILFDCFLLGWLGSKPPETPYVEVARAATFFYFFYFLFILPFCVQLEKWVWTNEKYIKSFEHILGKEFVERAKPLKY